MSYGFIVDTRNCIGCHTCSVACKDANEYKLSVGFREVWTFATGDFPEVRGYNVPVLWAEAKVSPKTGEKHGCDYCAAIRAEGEQPACVAACPMRAIEWGDLDELAAKHEDKDLVKTFPAFEAIGQKREDVLYVIKDCMRVEDFDRIVL